MGVGKSKSYDMKKLHVIEALKLICMEQSQKPKGDVGKEKEILGLGE